MKRHITNIISALFGKFASYKFSPFLQKIINNGYVFFLRLDMSEFQEAGSYESLNALFTRELKVKRDVQVGEFVSPCDGLISEQGKIESGQAFQIKGFSYSVKEIIGEYIKKDDREALKSGSFINLYLSPKDYHRFHAPCDMRVLRAIQIPGKLYPVNFKYLNKVPSLFCKNERVILVCQNSKNERFYLIFVGALNVGKISFIFDERIDTNAQVGIERFYDYKNLTLNKGDEIGRFEMGSTIVALFEKDDIKLTKGLQKVRFGEVIAN